MQFSYSDQGVLCSKMSKVLVCFLVASFLWIALALPTKQKGKKSEHCHYKGMEIKEGKSVPAPVGDCLQITCINGIVSGKTCGLFEAVPGCNASDQDLTKLYPHCCPRNIC